MPEPRERLARKTRRLTGIALGAILLTMLAFVFAGAEPMPDANAITNSVTNTTAVEAVENPETTQTPPPPQTYKDKILDHGLHMDEYYASALLKRAEAASGIAADQLLAEAGDIGPNMPSVEFRLALSALPDIFTSMGHVFSAVHAYKRSFWWSTSLWGTVLYSFIGAFLLALVAVISIRLMTDLPLIMHDINEKRSRLILPALILPFSALGPILLLLAAMMTVCLYIRKSGRMAFYISAAFVISSPFVQGSFDTIYSSRTPAMRAIVAVNEYVDNRYAITVLAGREDYMSRFALGLALKREGRIDESIAIYKGILDKDGNDRRALINLGNAYFAANRFPEARDVYQRAHDIDKTVVSAYNLSQAARATFDYASGDRFYDEAAALDTAAVSRFNSISSKNPNRSVMDAVYNTNELKAHAHDTRSSVITLYPFGTTAAMVGAGLLVILFTALLFTRDEVAHQCSNCGKVVCEYCASGKQLAGRCLACHKLLAEADDASPKAKVARMLSSMHLKNLMRDRIKALSFAPPGVAQVYAGKVTEGLIYLVLFLFCILGAILCAAPVFTTGLAGFSHIWFTPLFVVAAIFLYLVSLISVNRRLEIGWL